MTADRLCDALRAVHVPGEAEAGERAWAVARAAFGERDRQPVRVQWLLRPILAAVVVAAAAAAVLSPPGRALVGEVREAIGVDGARPALFRLPSPGRLLVDSEAGSWL